MIWGEARPLVRKLGAGGEVIFLRSDSRLCWVGKQTPACPSFLCPGRMAQRAGFCLWIRISGDCGAFERGSGLRFSSALGFIRPDIKMIGSFQQTSSLL